MIRNVYLILTFLLFASIGAMAQSGAIKGKIYDKATKEPLAFATVVAEINGAQQGLAQSNFDGEFTIKPLQPGKYTLKISYIGYNDQVINEVLVSIDKITFQDLALGKKVIETKEVEVIAYKVPLIEKGNTQVGATITREEITSAPTRDVKSVASQAAGITQTDDGDALNVRGGRSGATDYYIDGIRVRGSEAVPQSGIEQVTAIVGGTPAQYGDATSGIISITTRGPSKEFNAGVEYTTSELFDEYGYNLVSLNVSGPILKKKLENGGTRALLGFFVSGEYQFEKDDDPSNIGMYKLKDDTYDQLKAHPIYPYQTGPTSFGANHAADYYHADQFEHVKVKNNVASKGYRFNVKLDYQPLENTTLTFGGSYNTDDGHSFTFNSAMYNFKENPQIINTDYRGFARITQRIASTFKSDKDQAASAFRNVYFSIQGEYAKNLRVVQDPTHKDNLWAYGWFGKFHNDPQASYTADSTDGTFIYWHTAYANQYTYEAAGNNPETGAYNDVIYDFYQNATGQSTFPSLTTITGSAGGILNGNSPPSTMGEWNSIGTQFNQYTNTDNDDFRVTLSGSADIKNHAIRVGFEFEQRIDRSYQINPRGLWSGGRALANKNYIDADQSQLISVDTVISNVFYNYGQGYLPDSSDDGSQAIRGFYENLRDRNGIAYNQYVDFDALTPDNLDINMFNPDDIFQLVNNGIYAYYGYDYAGNKSTGGTPSFADFFKKKVNGVYTREIGAFQPTYVAGYIQDQFAIDNLNFNIGLRVDRFDANQKAIKDKYLLLDSYRVGDLPGGITNKPDNIGNDYVPYLANEGDFGSVVGYRHNDTWYDANGVIVSSPDLIASNTSNGIIYAAAKPDAGTLSASDWKIDGVYEDYKPQISVMPRIAFAFSITDEAQFFAHYDVLTQRPSSNLRNDPLELWNLQHGITGTINNSSLKPERTTDYEIGFKQVLSKSSALTISAFYREMKNLIQITKLYYADPATYTTYDNIDFGTVKGLSLTYDLRRTENVRLMASYTLQFAEGTGSGAQSNVELTDTDQPNLRLTIPLDFDQRHTLSVSMDYRYGEGSAYNGPLLFGKAIFANAGANVVLKANSGTPYTRQSRPTREGADIGWQDNGQRAVQGLVNGARNPWQFRIDMKIDKDFAIKLSEKKNAAINVYLQVQNVLNTQNVVGVYRVTGNPDDDGFLNSPDGQQLANSQVDPVAFQDQYRIKLLDPNNYSLPRRTHIGVRFDF